MLFAQIKNNPKFGGPAAGPAAGGGMPPGMDTFLIVLVGFVCVALIIGILIQVFFCLNLSRLLKQVHPANREIEPGQVWLMFIPFFSLYWIFAMTARISESLANEYHERRLRPDGDFCKQIGMWWGICTIASCVPYIGGIPGIAGLVLWIIYWIKTHGYRKHLERFPYEEGDGDVDDRDDDIDDRRRDKYDDRRPRDDYDDR